MPMNEPHHSVKFGELYGNKFKTHLTSYVALNRLESLIDEADRLEKSDFGSTPTAALPETGVNPAIFQYFYVGYVTCMEWHARSRLVDLLNWKPSASDIKDVRSIRETVVLDLIGSKITIPIVIGASLKINSFKDYSNVFERLIKEFDDKASFISLALGLSDENKSQSQGMINELNEIFEKRHSLVHEIGFDQLGHPILRENPSAALIADEGRKVHTFISNIEKWIRENSPKDFPNRILEDGTPESYRDLLREQMKLKEDKIYVYLSSLCDTGAHNLESIKNIIATYDKFMNKTINFMRSSDLFSQRWSTSIEDMEYLLVNNRNEFINQLSVDI